MTGSQSEPPSVEEATIGPRSSIRSRAEPLVAAGLAAHGTIVGLATFAPPPLLIAVVATLVFGGISLAYGRRGRARVGPVPHQLRTDILSDTVVLAVVGAGCWLIGRGLGTGAVFYCEPLVPWRIEIALFGSFGLAYLTALARQRRRAWAGYPLAVLALLWIAPFYGFFSAPLFLAVSLNTLCPDRPIPTLFLTAVGLQAGERVGLALAGWPAGPPPPRPNV